MTEAEAMELAIAQAEQCDWRQEVLNERPKVGAVVVIGEQKFWAAHRGEHDHAEKLALESVPYEEDLTQAAVFTTLEPCTRGVRATEEESCTERLIRAQVQKVVVGILDPNQGVCGKGLVKLQESKIEVKLFPHALAMRIRRLNDRFIRAQQTLGITITYPEKGDRLSMGLHTIKGRFLNPPDDYVIAMTYVEPNALDGSDGGWWPQSPVRIVAENQWEATVQFGGPKLHKVCIVRADKLGRELVKFYEELKGVRDRVIRNVAFFYCRDLEHVRWNIAPSFWGLPMSSLPPKGLDIQAEVSISVVAGDPAGQGKLIK